jgi:hypothetical protein
MRNKNTLTLAHLGRQTGLKALCIFYKAAIGFSNCIAAFLEIPLSFFTKQKNKM